MTTTKTKFEQAHEKFELFVAAMLLTCCFGGIFYLYAELAVGTVLHLLRH